MSWSQFYQDWSTWQQGGMDASVGLVLERWQSLTSTNGDLGWWCTYTSPLLWRHNGANASQITSLSVVYSTVYSGANQRKRRVTGLCAGNSPETVEFPAQMASNAENVSIWWRHHVHIYVSRIQWVIDTPGHEQRTIFSDSINLKWYCYFFLRVIISSLRRTH